MPIQPTDRSAGSQHVLRFTGVFEQIAATIAVYPKTNASYPTGAGAGLVPFRMLLADTTSAVTLTNTEKQLPTHVFDDRDPAGAAPHTVVLGGATQGILNATDQNISARTWCQNIHVEVQPRTLVAQGEFGGFDPSATRVCLDNGASSGLGTSTGFPVVVIGIFFADPNSVPASIDLDVIITVPHTEVR